MLGEQAANTWQTLFEDRWTDELESAPEPLQLWLSDQGSLTEKLTSHCQGQFSVQLLHQTMSYATQHAAEHLGLQEGDALLHREVLLCDGDRPLVFACSLLPEIALTGSYEELRQLDERPLGHWIFAEPALRRASVQIKHIPVSDNLFVRLGQQTDDMPDQLWGRSTCFSGAAAPLLVSEFFLFESFARP